MGVSFRKIKTANRLMHPLKDFVLDEIPLEIRYDPLTAQTGRVFNLPFKTPERPDLTELVERSKDLFCPFCSDKFDKYTPLFPEEVIPEGKIRVGQAYVIPNLLPLDKYAGVSILSQEHYVPMEDLTPEKMKDAFSAAQIFINRIADVDPEVNFFNINWNYMPQSGSSMVHPHLQVNCGEVPVCHLHLQLEGCKRYYEAYGRNFWQDFIEAERSHGERYIGEIGSTFWAMSFVPQSFLPDVWCIFAEQDSLIGCREEALTPFIEGLSRVLRYFDKGNLYSFNMSIFSVRKDEQFRVNARICPRLNPRPIGNSDHSYCQIIHKEPYSIRPPEYDCQKIRAFFED